MAYRKFEIFHKQKLEPTFIKTESLLLKSISFRNSFTKRQLHDSEKMKKQVTRIILDEHACERWNERVGPHVDEKTLSELLAKLMTMKERIVLISDCFGMIDGDIIFTYLLEETGGFRFTTFYGRTSLQPVLQGINELKQFNRSNFDKIDLSISEEKINEQQLPPIPEQIVEFQGTFTDYKLEVYIPCFKKEEPLYVLFSRPSNYQHGSFSYHILNIEEKQKKSVRKVLHLLKKEAEETVPS